MKNFSNKRIRTGLLAAALAGGTIVGATQIGGIANAQTDDTTVEDPTRDQTREERRDARHDAREESMQEIAALIGVDVDALHDWLRSGGTLAAVATENGVEPSAVIDLMVTNANERIDQAVEDGRIDADEADERRSEIQERITTMVNEGRPDPAGREARQGQRQVLPVGSSGDEGAIGFVRLEVDAEGLAVFVPSLGGSSDPGEPMAFVDSADLVVDTPLTSPTTTTTTTAAAPTSQGDAGG